jgi:hypothetical protein
MSRDKISAAVKDLAGEADPTLKHVKRPPSIQPEAGHKASRQRGAIQYPISLSVASKSAGSGARGSVVARAA